MSESEYEGHEGEMNAVADMIMTIANNLDMNDTLVSQIDDILGLDNQNMHGTRYETVLLHFKNRLTSPHP
ncbi:MAG: hypothetical protein OXC41_02370 [Gammaproteobacteria bacterium]|nr:hypothetical protein [Gammaproteobacteria bacterium]